MEYDGEDNLIKYKDAIGCTTTFEYEEKTHNLTSVTSPKGVKTAYTYNGKGQVTATETTNSAGSATIRTENEYTESLSSYGISAGAYLRYTYDENGYRTKYTYDSRTEQSGDGSKPLKKCD